MAESGLVRDDLHSDLGWALSTVLRAFAARGGHVFTELPGRHRGFQVLAAAAEIEGTQLALANRLGVDRTVMTYLLDDLEKAGLVERRPDPADRRARRVIVTGEGRDTIRALKTQLEPVEKELLGILDGPEQNQLRQLLRRVASQLDGPAPTSEACIPE